MHVPSSLLLAAAPAGNRPSPLIENDAVVLGILIVILAVVFKTSSSNHPAARRFYTFVPSLLLCYFIPGVLGTLNVISPDHSRLYFAASRYLLPTALVLLTLSLDLPEVRKLGPKMLIMFGVGTLGVMIGAPVTYALLGAISPDLVGGEGPNAVWRGMTTVAGSWIGGGANQAAMKEVFAVGDDIFSTWVAVDVLVANVWMAVLLYGAGRAKKIDARNKADASAIDELRERAARYQAENARIPNVTDFFMILAVGFGITGASHLLADGLAPWFSQFTWAVRASLDSTFFWIVALATAFGMIASMTRLRHLEAAGASKVGSVFLYVLVATIGMGMDLRAVVERPQLFVLGGVWIAVHGTLLLLVARLIRAPFFFAAVGSQANIGGAASAPVVASAFHPALAPVGVMLAVLGYAVGTYGAWVTGTVLRTMAGE